MKTWADLSGIEKFLFVFASVSAIGGALVVFLWGRF